MKPTQPLNAEEFAEQRFDFPEGGRWTELVAGEVTILNPPDDAHGNIVRNLSTLLAAHVQAGHPGYACFELGLHVSRHPDTVRCPAACYFLAGERFAEADKVVTDVRPALVIEIASTNDRRRDMRERVLAYLEWRVPLVWVVDPHARTVQTFEPGRPGRTFARQQEVTGGSVLPDFSFPAERLFSEPDWW
jgi:Uma2 family endonuclease